MSIPGMNLLKASLGALVIGLVAGCSAGGSGSAPVDPSTVPADLIVSVDKPTLENGGTDVATVTVTAVDTNRNVVSGAPVLIVPNANAVVTASATTTSDTGVVTGAITIGSDRSNRTIDVLVTSGSIQKHTTITVIGASLQATVGSAAPGATATIQYHLVDSNNVDMGNVPIGVIATGLPTVDAVTDANGKYLYSYTAPDVSVLTVTATAGGTSVVNDVTISTGSTPVSTKTVLSASLAANPANVNVNVAGSTANQVEVRALFLGTNNQPIQYIRVRFDLDGDASGVGGTLSSGTDYVYSDANGVARTTYIPGTRGSGNQKLTLRGCWSNNDFAPVASGAACPNNQEVTAQITVVDTGVSVSIFNNGVITPIVEQSIYQIDFAVQVVDSVGQPKAGVLVKGSVDLPRYYIGALIPNGTWVPAFTPEACANEDVNRNNVLETYTNGDHEDANGSLKLEPYAADAAIVVASTGSDTTDAFGKAYFHLQYGQNVASWDDFTVTFSAIVAGTEGRASLSGNLPVPAEALQDVTADPPFRVSPYGSTKVTTVTVTDPAQPTKPASLCTATPAP